MVEPEKFRGDRRRRLVVSGRPQMALPATGLRRLAVPEPGSGPAGILLHRRLRRLTERRPGRGRRPLRGDHRTVPAPGVEGGCPRYHGLAAFRAAIAENIRQARLLADLVDREPSLERVAEVPLSAVCFRWVAGDVASLDEENARILDRVNRGGRVSCPTPRCTGTSCCGRASPTIARPTTTSPLSCRRCWLWHRGSDPAAVDPGREGTISPRDPRRICKGYR